MFARYRDVFRVPGAAKFCAAFFITRVPIAMYPIGIVLIISARDGRYGFAGVLSACYVFGGGVGMIVLSMLVDRLGQSRVLLPATVVHTGAVIALAVLIQRGAPDWALVIPTVIFGFSYLPVGSLVRARWTYVLTDPARLTTAMSLESVLDEVIFAAGPLIATLLATQTTPVLLLYVAAGLVVVGSLWLKAQPGTAPPVMDRSAAHHPLALRAPGMLLLTVSALGMGGFFASVEVTAVAFCGQQGERAASGFALAAIAVGSALAGLVYGGRERAGDALDRLRRQSLLFAVLPFVLLGATSIPLLVVSCFILGLSVAPMLINAFALVQDLVPATALTEGLSWVNTGLSVGYGAGAALVGGIADQHGARSAFLVAIGASLLTGVLAVWLHARVRRHPRALESPGTVGAVREN